MKSKTKLLSWIRQFQLSKVTPVVRLLAVLVLCTAIAQAQESKAPVSTQELLKRLEDRAQLSEKQLNEVLTQADTSVAASMDIVFSRSAIVSRPRTRGVVALSASAVPMIDLELQPDATMRVIGRNDLTGLILTGKWIVDYARMIKLVPEYEKTLASYKSQAEIQQQLITELEGMIGVKDKKIETLADIADSQQRRGDLYKTMAEIESIPWYEKLFRKIAFPLGLTIGAYLGVKIAENN
jgi:hypothetical protein